MARARENGEQRGVRSAVLILESYLVVFRARGPSPLVTKLALELGLLHCTENHGLVKKTDQLKQMYLCKCWLCT